MPQDELQQIKDKLAILQNQIDVLKEHSHKHSEEDDIDETLLCRGGLTYPYNPDYEPDQEWLNAPLGAPLVEEPRTSLWEKINVIVADIMVNGGNSEKRSTEIVNAINKHNIIRDDKPSEFISIRRDVAEEFYNLYKGMTGGCLEKLTTAIKQELKD